MSKLTTLLVFLAAGLVLAACVVPVPVINTLRGSGNTVTQSYDFKNFDKVVIAHAFEAEITAGEDYSIEVTVDDNLVEHLRVEQKGDTVTVALEPGLLGVTNTTQRARITLPRLVDLEASGASRVHLSGFKTSDEVRVTVSGASSAKGDMDTGNIKVDVSGASTLSLDGSGKRLTANASGASTADLSDFAVTDASVEASGASRINVDVSGKLDASASGASSVRYAGDPTLGRIDESGASTISAQ